MSDATQNGPVGDSSGREVKKVTRLPKCFALFSVTDKYVLCFRSFFCKLANVGCICCY